METSMDFPLRIWPCRWAMAARNNETQDEQAALMATWLNPTEKTADGEDEPQQMAKMNRTIIKYH